MFTRRLPAIDTCGRKVPIPTVTTRPKSPLHLRRSAYKASARRAAPRTAPAGPAMCAAAALEPEAAGPEVVDEGDVVPDGEVSFLPSPCAKLALATTGLSPGDLYEAQTAWSPFGSMGQELAWQIDWSSSP